MKQAECSLHHVKAVNIAVGKHVGYIKQRSFLSMYITILKKKKKKRLFNRTEGKDFYTIKSNPLLQ